MPVNGGDKTDKMAAWVRLGTIAMFCCKLNDANKNHFAIGSNIEKRLQKVEEAVAQTELEEKLPRCLRELIVDVVRTADRQPPSEEQESIREQFIKGPDWEAVSDKLAAAGVPDLSEEERARLDEIFKTRGIEGLVEDIVRETTRPGLDA